VPGKSPAGLKASTCRIWPLLSLRSRMQSGETDSSAAPLHVWLALGRSCERKSITPQPFMPVFEIVIWSLPKVVNGASSFMKNVPSDMGAKAKFWMLILISSESLVASSTVQKPKLDVVGSKFAMTLLEAIANGAVNKPAARTAAIDLSFVICLLQTQFP